MAVNGLYARGLLGSGGAMGTEGLYARGLFGAGAGVSTGGSSRGRGPRGRRRSLWMIVFLALWVA